MARKDFKKGKVIEGIIGLVGELNQLLAYEHDFSTFVCQFTKQNRIRLGPIFFVNHSLVPNAVYKINLSEPGIVHLAASTSIKFGDEICDLYGSKYFEVNGVSTCQCPHKNMHGKTIQGSTRNSNKNHLFV